MGLFGEAEVNTQEKTAIATIVRAAKEDRKFDNGDVSTTFQVEMKFDRPASWKNQTLYLRQNKASSSHFAKFREALLKLKEDVANIEELQGRTYEWKQVDVRDKVNEKNRQYATNITATDSGREYGTFQRWVPARRVQEGESSGTSSAAGTFRAPVKQNAVRTVLSDGPLSRQELVARLVMEHGFTPDSATAAIEEQVGTGNVGQLGDQYALTAAALM